jgi:hypothetical protein
MPTITLPGWAPYANFLDPDLEVGHTMIDTKWPKIHPGKVMQPNFDEVVDHMRDFFENYEKYTDFAYQNAQKVHDAYDWDTITGEVFGDLERRIK